MIRVTGMIGVTEDWPSWGHNSWVSAVPSRQRWFWGPVPVVLGAVSESIKFIDLESGEEVKLSSNAVKKEYQQKQEIFLKEMKLKNYQ